MSFPDVIAVNIVDDVIITGLPHPNIIAIYIANDLTRWTLPYSDDIVNFVEIHDRSFVREFNRKSTQNQYVNIIQIRYYNSIQLG